MKRFLILLSLMFCNTVYADTINLHWLNYDGTTYQDSTCVIDSDLILPATPPTRYGYTFTGWEMTNYTPIEYLESTGTQWIDTNYIFTSNNGRIIAQFKSLNSNPGSSNRLCGAFSRNKNSSSISIYVWNSLQIGSGQQDINTNVNINVGSIYDIDILANNGILSGTINNTTFSKTYSGTIVSDLKFYIFRTNEGAAYPFIGYIYNFKIYDNDILVRDFIPVLDSNGVACLLDKVEGKFYYNAGTGNFIAGPTL